MKTKECLFSLVLCAAALPLMAAAYPYPDASVPPATSLSAGCRATDLIGSQIVGAQGQPVGKLSDVVFDMRHGRISFAVVTTREDERRIAVPIAVVLTQPGANTLTLACDEQKFRAYHDFAKSDLEDPNWVSSTYAYFDVTQPVEQLAAAPMIIEPAGAAPPMSAHDHDLAVGKIVSNYQLGKGEARQMDDKYWNNVSPDSGCPTADSTFITPVSPAPVTIIQPPAPKTCLMRASDLVGCAVQDANGRPVGDIKDAIVDWTKGRMIFAVLDPSGELTSNGRYIPIAPAALTRTPGGGALAVNTTSDTLAAAPTFDRAQWPAASDPDFVREVYRYYNQVPD